MAILLVCCNATSAGSGLDAESVKVENLFELSLEELLNVPITTASKVEERQSDAPGIVSVVTREELRRFGGTTLKDILERVPGLIGSTVYMTDRSMIAIRGDQISNSSEHVLLLINGRPVREVQEGGIKSEILETFPVEIIERIEVVRGPGSVLYGSNAFAGVINVITQEANQDRATIKGLFGEAGSFGTMTNLKLKSGDLGVIVAGRYLQKSDWPVDYVAASNGGTVVGSMRIPNKGTGAYLGMSYRDLSLMLAHNDWETAYFIPDFMAMFPCFGVSHWEKTFLNLGYDKDLTTAWRTAVNITFTRSGFEVSSWPNIKRDSSETLLEWTNFLTFSSRSKLAVGGTICWLEGIETDCTSGAIWSDGSRADVGLYAQIDYLLTDSIKLVGGAQANKIQGLAWDLVPRVGMIWYPSEHINVKAFYGQAFRAPSINETSLNHPALIGNPDLEPEKVGTLDFSIGYTADRTELALTSFRSNLTNIIYQDRSGFPIYANRADTVVIEGIELEGKHYLNKTILLVGSVTYQTSQDDSGNEDLSPIARLGAKAGVSLAWPNGITVGAFNVYQGPLSSKYQARLNPSPGPYNKLNLHCELDLNGFLQRKGRTNCSLIVNVDNLLDEQIWLPNWGLLPGQSIPYDQGRIIYAALRLEF